MNGIEVVLQHYLMDSKNLAAFLNLSQKALYPKLEERAKEATNILLDRLTSNRSKENLFGGMQPNLDIIEIFNKAAK